MVKRGTYFGTTGTVPQSTSCEGEREKREKKKKRPQSSSESRFTSGTSLVANSRPIVDAACLSCEYGYEWWREHCCEQEQMQRYDFISKARALFYNVGIGNVVYSQALQCILLPRLWLRRPSTVDVCPQRSSFPCQLIRLIPFAADMFGLTLVTECHLVDSVHKPSCHARLVWRIDSSIESAGGFGRLSYSRATTAYVPKQLKGR